MSDPLKAPEVKRALKIIDQEIENVSSINFIHYEELTQQVWENSGRITIIQSLPKIKQIPSEKGWRWNQSKGRISIEKMDRPSVSIDLMKLVPRKVVRSHLESVPSLKLWEANVYEFGKFKYTVFWCEKGARPGDLQLEDFSFLAKWMDPNRAQQLWPNCTE